MTVHIRPQQVADADEVHDVLTAAFGDDGTVADLAAALRARPDIQAGLVAVEDDRVVGQTHLSISWIDAPTRLVEVLVLSPLGVRPDRQRSGIGTALIAEALRTAEQLGRPAVFLEGDPAYYSRQGWRPASQIGVTPPSARIPAPACQVVTLPGHDARTMSGALVYNDTFWTYDSVGLRD